MKIELVPFRLDITADLVIKKIGLDVWSLNKDKDVEGPQMAEIAKAMKDILPKYAMKSMDRALCTQLGEELRPVLGPLNCIEIHWMIPDPLHSPERTVIRPPLDKGIIVVKAE